jgi:hypothetical protein
VQGVQTTESASFDFFYFLSWVGLQTFAAVVLAQHNRLWRTTKALLKGLALHPMAEIFKDVPRELFSNRLPPRGPRLIHLQHAVNAQAVLIARTPPQGPAIGMSSRPWSISSGGIATLQVSTLQTMLNEDLARPRCLIADSTAWAELLSDIDVLVPRVRWFRDRTPADPGAPTAMPTESPGWDIAAERYLAIPIALMLRELISRLVRGVYAIFAALVLLLAFQVSFPVYPRRAMMVVTWVYVVLGLSSVMTTIVGTERDAVLSRLAGTSLGKIEWDAAFVQRTLVPLLFALLTLFAVQFPEVGNTLLGWLKPVQTALP